MLCFMQSFDNEHVYVECQCDHPDHVIRFSLDPTDGEMWMETRLNDVWPWYRRIWIAVSYVFGRCNPQRYEFDTTLLREHDYDRLRDLFSRSEIFKAAALGRAREQLLKQ
jgi:hypothetical protein